MTGPTTISPSVEEAVEEFNGDEFEEAEEETEESVDVPEEEEQQGESELEELLVAPIIPKKRGHGQLRIYEGDVPSGSGDVVRVSEAQVLQISDQVACRVASSLDTTFGTIKRRRKM